MKKYLSIFLVFLMIVSSIFLFTSCSQNDVQITYNIDTGTIEVVVPTNMVNKEYASSHSSITVVYGDEVSTISICLSNYKEDDISQFVSNIKNEVANIIPSFAHIQDKFNIDITRNYFGSSISGSTYYTIKVKNETGVDIPIYFISSNSFLLNGELAKLKDDHFELLLNLTNQSDIAQYELQYVHSAVENMTITIDISDDTPSVEYSIIHNLKNVNADIVKNELQSYGMHVSYCKDNIATFSEVYDTNNDFQHVFPIQLYSVFGIVNTVKYKYSEFFTSNGEFELNLIKVPIDNVKFVIVGQDNTSFEMYDGENVYKGTNRTYNFDAKNGIVLKAHYTSSRIFATITSLLSIIAIIFVMFAMFFIVKKRNRGNLYYGN